MPAAPPAAPPPPRRPSQRRQTPQQPRRRAPTAPTRQPAAQPKKAAPWILAGGGYDALPEPQQAAARQSYAAWSRSRPRLAWRHDLRSYVEYVQQRADAPQAEAPQGIAPSDRDQAAMRRAKVLADLLREHYSAKWLPEATADRLVRVELNRANRCAVLHLKDGGRLVDRGERIELDGQLTEQAASELAEAAARHGWTSVQVSGSQDFRDAVSIACALREPPIQHDHTLSKAAQRRFSDALARRALAQVRPLEPATLAPLAARDPAAAARMVLDAERRHCAAALAGRPTSELDADRIAAPRLAELTARRDAAQQAATEARELAAEHRAAHSLLSRLLPTAARRRQKALDREAADLYREAEARRRGYKSSGRRIEKEARTTAKTHATALDDWRWSKPAASALRRQEALDRVAAAVDAGDEIAIQAAARGDLVAAISRAGELDAAAARAEREAARQAARQAAEPTDPRMVAVRTLRAAERAAEHNPTALAAARAVTAAAIGGDEATIQAAAAGWLDDASTAAAAWRQREEERQRRQGQDPAPDGPAPGGGYTPR